MCITASRLTLEPRVPLLGLQAPEPDLPVVHGCFICTKKDKVLVSIAAKPRSNSTEHVGRQGTLITNLVCGVASGALGGFTRGAHPDPCCSSWTRASSPGIPVSTQVRTFRDRERDALRSWVRRSHRKCTQSLSGLVVGLKSGTWQSSVRLCLYPLGEIGQSRRAGREGG